MPGLLRLLSSRLLWLPVASLVALSAGDDLLARLFWFEALGYDAAAVRAELRRELTAQVAPWCEKYPDVPVDCKVSQGSPGQVLTSQSRQAQLVVVGTRNRGRAGAMLLGSVGLQLLHHADYPVLIGRPRQETQGPDRAAPAALPGRTAHPVGALRH